MRARAAPRARRRPSGGLRRASLPQKGQDVLVEAWREVEARVPGAELVLVGSGPEESALRSRARLVGEADP